MKKIILKGDEKILIIPQNGIGDNIMMLPVAYNLKKQFPGIKLHFLSNRANKAAEIAPLSRLIEKVHVFDMKKYTLVTYLLFFLRQYFSIIRNLRAERYDYVIGVNVNLFIRSIFAGLYPTPALFRNKMTAFDNHRETGLRTLEDFGLEVKRDWGELVFIEVSDVAPVLKKYELPEKYVCLNSYGKSPKRTYLKMKKVAEMLNAKNYKVVLMGIDKQHKEDNRFIDTINKATLFEAIAILKKAALFITVDGGLMHLAFALRVPTIGLFGNLHSSVGRPIGEKHFFTKYFDGMDAEPAPGSCSEKNRINNIQEADIVKAAVEYLTKTYRRQDD